MKHQLVILAVSVLSLIGCEKFEANESYKDDNFELQLADTAGVRSGDKAFVKIVMIKSLETENNLKVEFATNKGEIKSKTVVFEKDTAVTHLTLDAEPGEYYITAQVKDGDKLVSVKSITYQSLAAAADASQFTFADTLNARADGVSLIKLLFSRVPVSDKQMKVTFTTSKGTLKFSDVTVIGNEAVSFLQLDRSPGVYHLKATLKDGDKVISEKQLTYTSLPAYPAVLKLESNKVFYNLTDLITIKTVLFNEKGNTNVSSGLQVEYNAFQLSPTNVVIPVVGFQDILNVRSDNDGKVPDVKFQPSQVIDTNRALYLRAETIGVNNTLVADTLELFYN